MRWLIGTAIKIRFLVLILAVVLMTYGLSQLQDMPVDVFPEFDPPLVEIQTEALGLSAAEMEALITVPLEADLLNGVAWLDEIYSESVIGLSRILLVFEPGTDPIRARQMVQERLTQTFALPNVSKPPTMLQPLSTTNRVLMIGLSSDELSLIDMGVLARWNIKPRLMGVPGVANVAIWGQREWQLQVQVDPEQLQDTGVTLAQVIETTGEALWVSPLSYLESSSPGTAGWIDTPNQRLSIRHNLPILSAEDLEQVPVKGTAWLLGDVATVVEDHQPLIGDTLLKDGPGLLLVVEKFPEANTLEVTRGVEQALDALSPGLSGIEIDTTVFRPANYIEQAVGNLSAGLLIGGLLAAGAIFVLLYNWRFALIPVVTIPLSLVAATYALYLLGATMNTMVFAGLMITLGLVVDDVMVDVENIRRRLAQHRPEHTGGPIDGDDTGQDFREPGLGRAILEASLEMRGPSLFATLIVLLAMFPVFFLRGLTGSFFEPLALSYTLAVLTSLAVALMVTPALSMLILANAPLERSHSPIMERLQEGYERVLASRVHSSLRATLIVAAIGLAGLAVLPFLRSSLLPVFKQTELRIEWEGPPGTSLPEMNRISSNAIAELQAIPGVRNVGSHMGRAITGDAVVGINSGEIWVSLERSADFDSTVAAVRGVMAGYPGILREVQTYQPERIEEALLGSDQDITVRVYGHEFDVLRSKAEELSRALADIDGAVGVELDDWAERPEVEIHVDLDAAERFQIKPGDVRRSVATLLSGLQVGNLYQENKVFDVVVWGAPEIRRNLSDLNELLIDTPRGGHVRLKEVADVRIAATPIVIRRDAVSRFIDVSISVRGRSLSSMASDVENRLQGVAFPTEYHAEVLGDFGEGQQIARQRLWSLIAAAAVGIFLLLQASFRSWSLASVGILVLPAALAGGALAVFATGGVLSLGALFGFLTVLAIAVRNVVLMFSRFQHLEEHENESFGPELVLHGARDRLAPILMTAIVTALLLLPLLFRGEIAGLEIAHPMAVVILGGLISSTLVSLLALPSLYLRFGTSREPDLDLLSAPSVSEAFEAGD